MATYRDAGVDLEAADQIVDRIRPAVTKTWHPGVVGGFGGFAAGISIPTGYTDPVLMMSTDGVGTKAELARRWDRVDGLGWDLVAMCVDDLVAAGALPIAMTDYLAIGRLDLDRTERIIRSVAAACSEIGIALLGGETAEHPGVLDDDQFDVAGTALGIVERGAEIDGSLILKGDSIVGVASPNLRANGFSLVRAAVGEAVAPDTEVAPTGQSAQEALLAPSLLYAPAVLTVLNEVPVHGLAHITGGGLPGNVGRILSAEQDAVLERRAWPTPAVFDWLRIMGEIPDEEMFRTFNMGVGFAVVVDPSDATATVDLLAAAGAEAWPIGRIVSGDGSVIID
ncbi:MAG: phosphoribosylformylglycinamidine cyclo-ligase [Acidimicrobiia bacterium]